MSTTVNASYRSRLTITENYDTTSAGAGRNEAPFDDVKSQDATSTPAIAGGGFCSVALAAGAATVDLTSLTTVSGRNFSLSGLKVRQMKLTNPSANANAITIAKGAANGYTGFDAAFKITLQPGQSWLFDDAGNGVLVDATHKTLDLTGTGTQALQIAITGGA